MGGIWALVTLIFIIIFIIAIAIFIYTDEVPKQDEDKVDKQHIFHELTESVLHHISGGGKGINFQGKNGIVNVVTTSKHKISLIPTYHNLLENTKQFLKNPKDSKDLYIIIDGEPNPIPRTPDKIDMVITTKRDDSPGDIYIPYYCMYAQQYKKPIGELFDATIPKRTNFANWKQREFIVFCYSNDNVTRYSGSANRALFYKMLSKTIGSRAHNTGKQCHGINHLITDNNNSGKRDYSSNDISFSKYKFVIAFENEQIKGYISEKFINPLLAGAIPVYLGAEDINEHFNPESFVNVKNYPDFQACINDLLEIDNNPERATKILSAKPLLHDEFLGYLKLKGGKLWTELMNTPISYLLPTKRSVPERSYFITFADGKQSKTDKIMDIAKKSRNFDECISLGTRNLPYNFLELHGKFIATHQTNYGLGIWKPTLIFRFLQNICDGDTLLFAIPGYCFLKAQCSESVTKSQSTQYISLSDQCVNLMDKFKISNGKVGVASYRCDMNYTEFNATKMECLRHILGLPDNNSDIEILNKLGNSIQLSADYILCIKCDATMNFFQKWISLCSNYTLLDSEKSKMPEHATFKKHFHDQSIFSCLMKIENQMIM